MFFKKSQSAMEYLMTYGWAILVVLIALAALFYMGVFDSSDVGQSAGVSGPFTYDTKVGTGGLSITLKGGAIQSATLKSLTLNSVTIPITSCSSTSITGTEQKTIYCNNPSIVLSSNNALKVNLDYIGLQSSLSHNLDLSATPKSEPYNFVYYGDFESFSLFNPISLNTASAINNINNFMTYTNGVGTHSLISDSTHGKVLSIIKTSVGYISLGVFNNKLAKITLTPGKKYKISFDAKAVTPPSCQVSLSIQADFPDPVSGIWNAYEPILECAITNQWTTCAKEAVYSGPSVANSVADNPNARFRTPNIVSSTCTSYYLDNIQFYQIN